MPRLRRRIPQKFLVLPMLSQFSRTYCCMVWIVVISDCILAGIGPTNNCLLQEVLEQNSKIYFTTTIRWPVEYSSLGETMKPQEKKNRHCIYDYVTVQVIKILSAIDRFGLSTVVYFLWKVAKEMLEFASNYQLTPTVNSILWSLRDRRYIYLRLYGMIWNLSSVYM